MLARRHAGALTSLDLSASDPRAHRVQRDPHQLVDPTIRGTKRLLRSLQPPLPEEPDNPLPRFLVVLASHDPFSPIMREKSLHQSQGDSASTSPAIPRLPRENQPPPLTVTTQPHTQTT